MKIVSTILCLFTVANVFAQSTNQDKIYLFDKEGNSVKSIDRATTYQVVSKENDSTYIVYGYKNFGPMMWMQTFKDEDLSIPNGRVAWYDDKGNIDSTGIAIAGKRSGEWDYYTPQNIQEANTTSPKKSSSRYVKYYENGKMVSKEEYLTKYYAQMTGDPNFYNTISEGRSPEDSIAVVAAKYPDGVKGWQKYLTGNLNPNLGHLLIKYKINKDGVAREKVCFSIDQEGKTSDIFILHSSGYPFDREVLRIIKESGNWIPAEQNHKKVVYQMVQQILFQDYRGL